MKASKSRSAGAALVLGAALALHLVATSSGATAAPGPWTGTWAASPQAASTTFNQQTLRQTIRTSIGGTETRIRLSNVFGSQAVTFQNVHIALAGTGSAVVTSSDRQVTFNSGATSVVIPAGGSAVSDSIAFPVAPETDVTVSFYLPLPTGPATQHQTAKITTYVASGDVSANATLTNPQTSGSYWFLTNLDVQNPSATGSVVTLGASITDGVGTTHGANRRWSNLLASRLNASGRSIGVLNQGISGNRLLADGAGQSALNRFDRDVLSQPGVKWVIFSDDPINDLASGNPPTGAQLISGLQQLISRAHAAGVKFVCSTLTPFKGASAWKETAEVGRAEVNAFIRGSDSGCDAILDQDTATHDPANPQQLLPAFDPGDHLHPNDQGHQAIASALNLDQVFGSAAPPSAEPLSASFNNIGVTDDGNTSAGNWDGGGATFSKQALAAAGAVPGATLNHDGLTFTWPAQAGTGSPDNAIAQGQRVAISGSGKLGFLVSGSWGSSTGTGTVHYTDGSSSTFTLSSPDWFTRSAPPGMAVVLSSAYQNRPNNARYNAGAYVFYMPVTLAAGKTMSSVTLPVIGTAPVKAGTSTLHVFAVAAAAAGLPATVSLRSHANNRYVTADNAGTLPLIASRTTVGPSETFNLVDVGNGNVALRARANGKYVCAENAGASPLIANRDLVAAWETFALIRNPDGSVSFRAEPNGMLVAAEAAGSQPLIANRTVVGPWEKFDMAAA